MSDGTQGADVNNLNTGRRFTLDPAMTYGQMRQALAKQKNAPIVFSMSGEELGECGTTCGVYDECLQAIAINRDMTYVQKRCTLVHELFHWLHGHEGCDGLYGSKHERLVRRETAIFLINPVECAIAETAYEGDEFNMSADLDVTVQVLEDYRRMLRDGGSPIRPAPSRMGCGGLPDRVSL